MLGNGEFVGKHGPVYHLMIVGRNMVEIDWKILWIITIVLNGKATVNNMFDKCL